MNLIQMFALKSSKIFLGNFYYHPVLYQRSHFDNRWRVNSNGRISYVYMIKGVTTIFYAAIARTNENWSYSSLLFMKKSLQKIIQTIASDMLQLCYYQ